MPELIVLREEIIEEEKPKFPYYDEKFLEILRTMQGVQLPMQQLQIPLQPFPLGQIYTMPNFGIPTTTGGNTQLTGGYQNAGGLLGGSGGYKI